MRYVSLFSGIEAATVAWQKLGWKPLAFAEIDPFACAVLANRFPDVPNLGNVIDIDWSRFYEQHGNIDVLIGGSPCQNFSIAGDRLGLLGTESRLMYEYIRAIREIVHASDGLSPRYVVWENVPGALSSGSKGSKGEDFRCLLEALDECGFGVSWRVLDSQFARVYDRSIPGFRGPVPQRRRRIYLVGSLGTDGSAEILFERGSMSGDYPTGRKAREAVAGYSQEGHRRGDSAGFKWFQGAAARGIGFGETSPTLSVSDSHVPAVVSTANNHFNGSNANTDDIAYTLDGTNCNAVCIHGNMIGRSDSAGPEGCGYDERTSFTLNATDRHAVAYERVVCVGDAQTNAAFDEHTSGTLNAGHEQPIVVIDRAAFNQGKNAKYPPHMEQADVMDALVARGPHAVCYRTETRL